MESRQGIWFERVGNMSLCVLRVCTPTKISCQLCQALSWFPADKGSEQFTWCLRCLKVALTVLMLLRIPTLCGKNVLSTILIGSKTCFFPELVSTHPVSLPVSSVLSLSLNPERCLRLPMSWHVQGAVNDTMFDCGMCDIIYMSKADVITSLSLYPTVKSADWSMLLDSA